jgi:hypothetical protein
MPLPVDRVDRFVGEWTQWAIRSGSLWTCDYASERQRSMISWVLAVARHMQVSAPA